MNVGIIGTGSMGSILVESFMKSCALEPKQLVIHNRTEEKAFRLQRKYPGITVANSCKEVVSTASVFFICVKPLEYKHVLDEIRSIVSPSQIAISITSPVLIEHLQHILPCKVVKMIPSITNFACSGASLIIYGANVNRDDRAMLQGLLSAISTPIEIEEKYTRVASDISSCGPAFLTFFLLKFIDAAVEETGISREKATRLASEMLLGTGKLLANEDLPPENLVSRVCVPGGITAEGIKYLDDQLHGVFNQLIRTTHHKYYEDLEKVEAMVFGSKVE